MKRTNKQFHVSGGRNWPTLAKVTGVVLVTAAVCSAAGPTVSCALPISTGNSDQACVGSHYTVVVNTANTTAAAKVKAELLGLDASGKLINSLQVANGDRVQLGSRISPTDWKFNQNKNMSQVFAPVPLLRVTVEDQGQTAEAFCSNIPYVEVIRPNGGVVTESSGNHTNVLAAVPLTNRADLHLYVDGVDLLPRVGIPMGNYLACTVNSPCSGNVVINGQPVQYSNLIVDVAPNIGTPASNTIRATLTNLSCGGHIFRVSSTRIPGVPAPPTSAQCNIDPLSKAATSSVFAVKITSPLPNQVVLTVPTPVSGEVCSGTPITAIDVSGKGLPVPPPATTLTPGDGTTTGDVYKVPINTTLARTDLLKDAFQGGAAQLGTFDRGTNRLAASAKDDRGNRTFKNVIFATGEVAAVAVDPNAQVFQSAAVKQAMNDGLKSMVQAKIDNAFSAPATTDLANAFIVGLSAGGTQRMFNKLCTSPIQAGPGVDPTVVGLTPGQAFSKKVKEAILAVPAQSVSIPSPCSCDPNVNMQVTSVSVGTNVACTVTFNDGSFDVSMGLPEIKVVAQAKGWCRTSSPGISCVEGLAVALEGTATVTGVSFTFRVTESNLLNNTVTPPAPDAFYKGTLATSLKDIQNEFGDNGISFCGLSVLCDVLVTIFTFGQLDITPSINISQVQDFSGQIGASQPDPVKLKQIKVDETKVVNFDQKLSGAVSSVRITPAGIAAGLKGTFASTAVDPDVPTTPGVTLTPAGLPTLPLPKPQDVFVGISDDAINMMFASLTAAGKFQTGQPFGNGCIDTNAKVGDLLPANCDTLALGNDLTNAGARGYCHAIRGSNCGTLSYNNPALSAADNANLTSTERGICYGAQGLPAGQTCATVANSDLVLWGACSITPSFNLRAAQPLIFCAKGDVPPRMLFPDTNDSTGVVPSVLRVPSLSVSLIIDRDLNHQTLGALTDVPGCFAQGTSTAVDCNVFSACLALNLNFSMSFQTCSDGKPGFVPQFNSVQVLTRQAGTVCGGATSPTADGNVLAESSDTSITIPLGQNGAQFAPPICGAGLDLGGFVQCTSPTVLSVRAPGTLALYPESKDYLAIGCKIP